ncbi:hypothetical protein TH66_17670 [Carbonactinospora thermoautotrophica]|uniref:HTH cro/C1-type domain-containing protein n=2 Tax=Carbonactinospora thermoautotrophica TaxID=1469144 RepID=A0A132NJ83_9ACTN|nr:hypothetical protein TH66_17670 [Carbonactinospora thermoautotrophica]KWX10189.1 hypothetical protein TR74_05120 [Carbonactinospora thermoautotrophica]
MRAMQRKNEALRRLRRERGWTRQDLVERLRKQTGEFVSEDTVKDWERGRIRCPHPRNLRALSEALGVPAAALGFDLDHNSSEVGDAAVTVEVNDHPLGGGCDPVQRRDFIKFTATATVAASSEGDALERLAHALKSPGRADSRTVAVLESETTRLFRLDTLLPPQEVLPKADAHIAELASLLNERQRGDLWKRLVITAGETAALAGWMAWNADDRQRADRYHEIALDAAREANHPPLEACVMAYRSYMLAARGDAAAARDILRAAQDKVRGPGNAATFAWLAAREAEEAGALGERDEALRALERARTAHEFAAPGEHNWSDFFSSQRLGSMAVSALARLRHKDLEREAEALLKTLEPADTKTMAVVFADLALAEGMKGEIEPAVVFAEQSLSITHRRGGGAVARRRLRDLDKLLPDEPRGPVAELRERLRELRDAA